MSSASQNSTTTSDFHPESAFLAAMNAAGLEFQGPIITDGVIHRVKINGDRNPNSWYSLHLDHPAAGSFGCWKRGIKENWCGVSNESLTEAERAERDRKWKQQQAERDAERRRQNNEAAQQAQAILDAARPATGDHPYLTRKNVKAYPGVQCGEWPQRQRVQCLLIPLRNAAGLLATVEAIFPTKPATGRDKDFLRGGAKTGAYFVIGDLESSPIILLAEGYATAATLHEAMGYAVVMAADSGNLKPVAEALAVLYRGKRIIIAADNDRTSEKNDGVTKATAAAKAIKAALAIPQFADDEAGSDCNDLAALHGLDVVKTAIDQAGKPVKAERPQAETERAMTIQCIPGELPEMVDKAESALCKFEENFYQRGGQLVRWCVSRVETVKGIARPGGAVIIIEQDADYLLDRLNRLISWERWNEDKEDYVPCNAPRTVATTLRARRGHWKAQPLVAAINAPTLRPDGSILDAPGYDAATGLLFVNTAVDFPPIPQQPSRENAAEALAFLTKEVLSGFPFANPHDQSAALSAILTACVCHALKNTPMHTFNAPVMASGKSLLADVVALIATGHPATVMSYTPDGDEMRKRVLSVLMQGDLVVNLDNVEEPLSSQTLCTVLTQEAFTDRILGVNKTGTAPTLCCWLATGNNLVVAGDLTTRIVPCNLDPQVERPEEREFSRNLYDWIPVNRPRLVQAVLTIIRAYVVAGKPKQPLKNFARFEDWSGLVRSALVWLGEADPLTGREQIEDGDPVRIKLRALLLAWFATFKTAPATSKEAVTRANETELDDEGKEQCSYPAMKEALEEHFTDRKGTMNSNGIGYFLRQHAGRILAGARFEAYGGNKARSAWRIVISNESQFKSEKGKISDPL
ncbi:MAG: toprim domain-containing protein, partial [Candidatus Contendobacter sp.]|nr:toprim domain-containing protein [Candidatus Contendobacter sp.]